MSKFKVKVLGVTDYESKDSNHGDCFAIYNQATKKMIVYDCGSEQHAEAIIKLMNDKGIKKTDIILSHNDGDHFDGIPKLIEEDKVDRIFTTLLLKYVDDILEMLDDDRRTRKATKERILELYDNIAQLSGTALKDIYEDSLELPIGINFIGPEKDTMIEAVSKAVKKDDTSIQIDNETIVNSTSLQISVEVKDGTKLLLLGDTSVKNVLCDLKEYKYIHLPHHGKLASAEDIFEIITNDPHDSFTDHTFIVSDNTGNSNGGSDALMSSSARKGKTIKNTKISGALELKKPVYQTNEKAREHYGLCFGL